MDKNIVAEQREVEAETTQTEGTPAVESPITRDETAKEEVVDQTSVSEVPNDPEQTELERREFQNKRLAEENRRLKEELTRPKESAFDAFRPQPNPPVSQQQVRIENFTDPITGETNWQAYNGALQVREQQILQQARFEAQQAVQEQLDEERARTRFPEVMNNAKLEKRVAAEWFYQKAQGNNVSIAEIAEEYARDLRQTASKAEKIGAEKALNEVSEKEKAGLVAPAQTSQGAALSSNEDAEQLSVATRGGNQDAITARISKIPWANK